VTGRRQVQDEDGGVVADVAVAVADDEREKE
jgi:hypothetical protein